MQTVLENIAEAGSVALGEQNHQFQRSHELALTSLQLNHATAVQSLDTLANAINTLQDKVVSFTSLQIARNWGLIILGYLV